MTQPIRRAAWFVSTLTAALVVGCDPATSTDQNFDTNVGADYRAPAHDAGDEAGVAGIGGTAEAGRNAGTGGTAATGGAAGEAGALASGS
jgi:hypothetical protein